MGLEGFYSPQEFKKMRGTVWSTTRGKIADKFDQTIAVLRDMGVDTSNLHTVRDIYGLLGSDTLTDEQKSTLRQAFFAYDPKTHAEGLGVVAGLGTEEDYKDNSEALAAAQR